MVNLRATHPTAYQELRRGQFAVQRSSGNAFAQVPVDQAIEQSLNSDSKPNPKGRGITGFSRKPAAVHRWVVTTHERAAIVQLLKQVTQTDGTSSGSRSDGGKSSIA